MDLIGRVWEKVKYKDERDEERKVYMEEFKKEKQRALRRKARIDARAEVLGKSGNKASSGSLDFFDFTGGLSDLIEGDWGKAKRKRNRGYLWEW